MADTSKLNRRQVYLLLAVFLTIAGVIAWNFSGIRTTAKWLVLSRHYKAEVLAQPASATGQFRHIAWDGWGWAGQDTAIYLVFDPTDSLSAAASSHRPGMYARLPCEVFRVRRLESDWYAVQFYTNEFWGRRNTLNCVASDTH